MVPGQPGYVPPTVTAPAFTPPPTGAPPSGTTLAPPAGSTTPGATVGAPRLELRVTGPETATVGSDVRFEIEISNRGTAPATGLVISNRFDPGLVHAVSASPIERELPDLGPGATKTIGVTFRVSQAGQLSQDVTVTGAGGLSVSGRRYVAAFPASSTGSTPPATGQAPPSSSAPLPGSAPSTAPGVQAPGQTPSGPSTDFPSFGQESFSKSPETGSGQTTPPPRQTFADPGGTLGNPLAAPATAKQNWSVKMTGPSRHTAGEIAKFTIEVRNAGATPLKDVRISNNYELSLEPTEATIGYNRTGGALVWTVASIEPGKTVQRQVNCRCVEPVARACNRVTVTVGDVTQGDEVCLEVVGAGGAALGAARPAASAPTGKLALAVADQVDPVRVGNETIYQIVLSNKSSESDQDVVVSASVPEQMTLMGIVGPLNGKLTAQSVKFFPVKEMRAGENLTYEVRVRAERPGSARFEVEATSARQPTATREQETTEILER